MNLMQRVKLYFTANGVDEDKQVASFLTVCGSTTYALLKSLLTPEKPQNKSLDVLITRNNRTL